MFSAHHPLASDCWQTQRQTQCSPRCAAKAGSVGGGLFSSHGAIVVQQDGERIPKPITVSASSMTYWPGTNTPKSLNNAFTQRPASVFAADKAEQAKATLARKGSHYGQATGAVGHGAAVMPTLSKKAQMLLKATPFSEPIAPSKSLAYRAKKS
jgi:hypothetical protein